MSTQANQPRAAAALMSAGIYVNTWERPFAAYPPARPNLMGLRVP